MKQIKILVAVLGLMLVAGTASAHVTVRPSEVGVGSFQTFNVSVPVEKDVPTTGLRLVIPMGLEHVSPTVKPGWNIRVVEGDAETGPDSHQEGVITEIIWTGGSIPGHFRDDFTFSARVPAEPTTLLWKAYQTYRDGTVVAWELAPNQEQPKNADGSSDFSQFGPASQTKIIDDLAAEEVTKETPKYDKNTDSLIVSMLAVVLSVFAIYFARRRS